MNKVALIYFLIKYRQHCAVVLEDKNRKLCRPAFLRINKYQYIDTYWMYLLEVMRSTLDYLHILSHKSSLFQFSTIGYPYIINRHDKIITNVI